VLLFIVMSNVIVVNVIMPSVIMLSPWHCITCPAKVSKL
jgi:hypothetical protein